jgi:AAA ATPase domain
MPDNPVRKVTIFFASPTDVMPERERAARVADRLQSRFREYMTISTVFFEEREQYYTADKSFQEQIPDPSTADLVVSIFWSRLGSELPPDLFGLMPDGRPYPGGAVYELIRALESKRQKKLPDILVYRKIADTGVSVTDPDQRRLMYEQLDAFEAFWRQWFVSEEGHFRAGFQTFNRPDDFEQLLETHLRAWLSEQNLLGKEVIWRIAVRGSPFRGLAPYEAQHAEVFFGRDREIDLGRQRLITAAAAGTGFLLIMGPSGSGKSSLARAGLAPRLTQPGDIDGVDLLRVAVMRPGEATTPQRALADALFRPDALPELVESDFPDAERLAHSLTRDARTAVAPILRALDRGAANLKRSKNYDRPVQTRLLLIIDQLEELFSDGIPEAVRLSFVGLVVPLARSGRVLVLTTLRSSSYGEFARVPDLIALKDAGATLDVAVPGPEVLTDIVGKPAAAAGLIFDRSGDDRLDEVLLATARGNADALPLLGFTLQWLFEHRQADLLTFASYGQLGGLEGAIGRAAEHAFTGLDKEAQAALPRLLRGLAEAPRGGGRLALRDMPLADAPAASPLRHLADALVSARVLLIKDSGEEATLRLAHEAVLRGWERARDIAAREQDFFRIREDVTAAEKRWHGSRRGDLLLSPGLPLVEAQSLRTTYGTELGPEIVTFIDASSRKDQARQRRGYVLAAVFGFAAIAAIAAGVLAWREQGIAETQKKLASEHALKAEENAKLASEHALKAEEEARKSERQLGRANQAQAAEILADLELNPTGYLTARQRNALWKLATSDDDVRARFISAFWAYPEDMARSASGFNKVFRSLGLQWPSASVAEKLFTTTVGFLTSEKAFGSLNPEVVANALQALAAKLTPAQAQEAAAPLLRQIGKTTNDDALYGLAQGLRALAPKLSALETQEVFAALVEQLGKSEKNLYLLNTLAEALKALSVDHLTERHLQEAVAALRRQIARTPDPFLLEALVRLHPTFTAKLTEAQVQGMLASLLQQMGETTNPNVLFALAQVLQGLLAKLEGAEAKHALTAILQQIGKTTDAYALAALTLAVQSPPSELTAPQAKDALAPLLQLIGKTTEAYALRALAVSIGSLPAELTDAQARQALAPLMQQIFKKTNLEELRALIEGFQALASKLTNKQAQGLVTPFLQQIGKAPDEGVVAFQAGAIEALAVKLTPAQAQQAQVLLLQKIDTSSVDSTPAALGRALEALPAKLTDAQAQQALASMLTKISKATDDDYMLGLLTLKLDAVAPKLTETQAQQALVAVLQLMADTTRAGFAQMIGRSIPVLASKLTEAQARQVLAPLLQQMGHAADDVARPLILALRELASKLAEVQAQEVFAPLLQRIGMTADADALRVLAEVLRVLAAKLTNAQAQQALAVAMSSLAWAATDDEAVEWARAFVALLPSAEDQDGARSLVAAIVYPASAGPTTEILLSALRARHSDAPLGDVGTEASFAWIAEKYPNLLRPICPSPPQRPSLSGLRCPIGEAAQSAPINPLDAAAR